MSYIEEFNCKICKWFDRDRGVCDMCAYGYPYAIDNNLLKPEEVEECNAFIKKDNKQNER